MSKAISKCDTSACEPTSPAQTMTVSPVVDIVETEHDFTVRADMPGVAAGDVDLRFENGELSVHGKRKPSAKSDQATNYFRAFRVNEKIASDKIEANLRNGVLTLKLPKIEAVKPRKIAVKS